MATLQSLEEGQKKWEKPGIMNPLKEHQTLVTNPKACNLQIAWKSSKYGLKETQWDTRELKLIMPWNLGKWLSTIEIRQRHSYKNQTEIIADEPTS